MTRFGRRARFRDVEVTDARAGRVPPPATAEPPEDSESGRGLLIVATLATRWAVLPREGAPGKTVRAELDVDIDPDPDPGFDLDLDLGRE